MWMVLLMSLTVAISPASSQSSCTDVLLSMLPCLDYITQNASSPSQQCCNQFAHVVQSSSECLCLVLNGGGSHLGISFNETQALALPKACNVQTPPVSRCNVGSSVNTHVGSSNTSELHGNGSKTVPRDGSSSDVISYFKRSSPLLAILTQYQLTSLSSTDLCLPIKLLASFNSLLNLRGCVGIRDSRDFGFFL